MSDLFRNLFYIYQNGLAQINSLTNLENSIIINNTVETSNKSNLFIDLISFISIGMFTFIGIFTFPMLGKIEDRKISVLKFFNMLSVDQIQIMIQKGEDYREEFSSQQRNVNLAKIENTVEEEESDNGHDEGDHQNIKDEYGASDVIKRRDSERFPTYK